MGHQLNDLAEDSLMRLIRGGGWPALAGMAGVDAARRILRPMLLRPRGEVEAFLRSLGVRWVDDAMNADTRYLRNRVRHEILPLFIRENAAFLDSVAFRWRMARLDEAFFREQLGAYCPPMTEEGVFLARDVLRSLSPALRMRFMKKVLDALGPGQARADTLLALENAWRQGEGRKTLRFPGHKSAVIHKGGILCRLETKRQ
jgi:tRNA(Ile)-lysidine synthase